MHIMNTVRLNITLPVELAKQLETLVGPRKKSRFITETLQQRVEKLQREALLTILEQGYKTRKEEGLAFAKEFEPADLTGWDDY